MLQNVHLVLILFIEMATWRQTDGRCWVHDFEVLTPLAFPSGWASDDLLTDIKSCIKKTIAAKLSG